ncbi:MAG: NAD(P)-dependent oxidoreductase [Trebonia sp.]
MRSPAQAPIAVIGLGAMGSRIASRLLDAGRQLLVWNRTPGATAPLVRRGAIAAASPADAARRAGTVIVMVADPAALTAVSEGADGLMSGLHADMQVIVMSTVGPAAMNHFAGLLPATLDVLDAPVLGSLAEAEHGRLQIFVGGSRAAVTRAKPLLQELGTPLHAGGVGAGSAAKLVANHALLGVITVLGETIALAGELQLPRRVALEVLGLTPLAEQAARRRAVLDGQPFPARYRLSLARKDTDLMVANTSSGGSAQRLLPAIRSWLAEAEDRGRGDHDYLAILTTIMAATRGTEGHHAG